ncbi:MAG: hypothetical protein EBR30_11690 [Cytophagia bacterium]|nr:hypothetical protein [Cytophagia bacterium]
MAKSLTEVMKGKTNEGLMDYIDNFHKYSPEAIQSAVDELKRRGKHFSEQELTEINLKISKSAKAEDEEDTLFAPNKAWEQNVITDPNAPLFYSKAAISAFSLFFSTVFGAVLLSYNINDTKRKWIVISFGVVYTTVSIILLNLIPQNIFYLLLLNTAGGLALTSTFWDKFIGKETQYRAKPIWKPLIISIIIGILFLLAIIYSK